MKRLNDILNGVSVKKLIGNKDQLVSEVYLDSRKVKSGGLFFAVKGLLTDGHLYINNAIEKGAKVIICEKIPDELLSEDVTYVQIENFKYQMAKIVGNFYDHPDKSIKLIGVTGTNGKTTIATLLYNLMMKMGIKSGLLSTIENKIGERTLKSTHTTPDVINLNKLIKNMREDGCEYIFMEVSSHAIDQDRISDLDFDGAIFTNLTHDHLDSHGTFAEYLKTKKKFFDNLKNDAFALTNIDDRNGKVMVQNSKARIFTYSLKQMADYKGKILQNSILGLQLKINGKEVFFKLPGEFNAYNLLAIYGTFSTLGFDETEILIKMSELESATGRFEIIFNPENSKYAICDYAHTPDALKNI
ncbi:MAG TPA: UDP-N-acetylmuramoyl-L-alanyl-D-glutamate--2,6-diaminopimelate ligase, partial [Saprospiraceae bacterium]|nr:UDP-N-acetylmuramoyl-L-alanyl-D-glutamate--2,6-diaminopimelate ligase [Saprospiraceae bacterium]